MRILWAFYTQKRSNATVGQLIEEKTKLHPNKILFYFENETWTYERVKAINSGSAFVQAIGFCKCDARFGR